MSAASRAWQRAVKWWRSRPVPVDQVSLARQVHANRAEISKLRAQVAECRAQYSALADGICRMGAVTGREVPPAVSGAADTQPILRAV